MTTRYQEFTGTSSSIAAGDTLGIDITGMPGNNFDIKYIKLVPSAIGAGKLTRFSIHKKDTCLAADRVFDTINFEGNLYCPKFDDGTGPADLNQGYVCDYEDLDGTNELHLKIWNNGNSSRTFDYTIRIELKTSGEYTPTITNTTNVAASTAFVCQYILMGNYCLVGWHADIDPTAAGPTASEIQMTLPIPSDFSAATDANGSGSTEDTAGQSGRITADATSNKVRYLFLAESVANNSHGGTYIYRIR